MFLYFFDPFSYKKLEGNKDEEEGKKDTTFLPMSNSTWPKHIMYFFLVNSSSKFCLERCFMLHKV